MIFYLYYKQLNFGSLRVMINIDKIVKNMANIALLIILISIIIERIKPSDNGNIFTYILISLAGLISIIGFIILIKVERIEKNKMTKMKLVE